MYLNFFFFLKFQKKRTRRCRIHRRCREVVKEEHVKEEEAGVEGDGRDVEEVKDEAVEAVVATEDVEEETVEDVEGKEVDGV